MSQYITEALTGQPLADVSLSGKPRPWRQHKTEARTLAAVYELLADKHPEQAARWLDKSRRVADCAPWMEYELHDTGDGAEYLTLHKASFCRVRLCPMCQWRRSLKLAAQARAVVSEVGNRASASVDWLDPDDSKRQAAQPRWLLLTLTVRNVPGDQLSACIDQLHASFSRLTKRAVWRPIRGWLRATEVTYNADADTYHPHIHVLLMVSGGYFGGRGGYVSQRRWRAEWAAVAGLDYDPQVDVRAVKGLDGKPIDDLPKGLKDKAMGAAVAEVAKYAAKPADYLDPSDLDRSAKVLATLDTMLHKRRMVAWGGELKRTAQALQLDDLDSGDLVHIDETAPDTGDGLGVYLTYVWRRGSSDYLPRLTQPAADPDPAHRIVGYTYRQVCEGIRERVRVSTAPMIEVAADPVTKAAPSWQQTAEAKRQHRADVAATAAYRSRQEHEEMEWDQAAKLARRMGRHYRLGPIHNREED